MYHWFWHYKETIYTENHHQHTTPLPYRFREPENSPSDMHCLNTVLKQVKTTGYSHHITRLMIIGNFCQLAGFNPHDVNKRFWEMYADAFERVVTPNVLGMSQFADG
jgi:deoxyribodipyrimidine photolyase-related protein